MDKSCHSSNGDSASSNSNSSSSSSNGDAYLKQLNKLSHKISKPIRGPSPPFIEPPPLNLNRQNQAPPTQSHPSINHNHNQQQQPPAPQQQQPPVYNINKSDFRDVVQRLTGSPAHERSGSAAREGFSASPPIQQPKQTNSRLQRIRPAPLAQISNRPPDLLNCAAPPTKPPPNDTNPIACTAPSGFLDGQRQPLSPLPPFPAVHAAAESPISAYMRFLQNSFTTGAANVSGADTYVKKFPAPLSPLAPLASPRWNNLAPPSLQMLPPPLPAGLPPQQQQQNIPPPTGASTFPALPTSPSAFGCSASSGLLSPGSLFSPTGQLGFPQLPLSPTPPVLSPGWKGH